MLLISQPQNHLLQQSRGVKGAKREETRRKEEPSLKETRWPVCFLTTWVVLAIISSKGRAGGCEPLKVAWRKWQLCFNLQSVDTTEGGFHKREGEEVRDEPDF